MLNEYLLNLKYQEEGEIFEESMQLEFSTHATIRMNRVYEQIGTIQDFQKRIIFLLEQVPQFLLEEVKVGEKIAVFDWFTHTSFSIAINFDRIKVLTVFSEKQHHLGKSLKMYEGEKFIEFSANDITFGVFTKLEQRTICD